MRERDLGPFGIAGTSTRLRDRSAGSSRARESWQLRTGRRAKPARLSSLSLGSWMNLIFGPSLLLFVIPGIHPVFSAESPVAPAVPATVEAREIPPAVTGPAGVVPGHVTGHVSGVQITGNKRVEQAALLAKVNLHVGEDLADWKLQRDIRALYQSGFVEDVRVDTSPAADGSGYLVTFVVKEKPAIREVKISGNKKIEEDDIRAAIDIPAFAVLNESQLQSNVQHIRDLYVEKGYFLAEVDPEVKPVGENLVELNFKITENRKVLVSRIDISGNENIPDRKIRKYLQTRQAGALPWLTSSGTFKQENVESDRDVVRSVYLEEGYVDVKVDAPKTYLSPDKRHIFVSFHVDEGPRYRIGKIDVKGDFVPPEGLTEESIRRLIDGADLDDVEADNAKKLGSTVHFSGKGLATAGMQQAPARTPLKTGDWFKLTQVQGLIADVTDLYADQGYAFANVVPLTNTDPGQRTVDITFDVQRGEKVSIGRINVTGNDPTFDKVVRREIPINEGDWYSSRALKEARARLQRLGFFEEVNISTPKGQSENQLDMNVNVKEQPTGTFSLGAGFSTLENFVFTFNVSKNNFLGLGYVMSAAANVSKLRQQGNLSFFDPYFFDTRWTMQVNAYSLNQQYIENEYQRGGSLAIGRYLDPRDDLRLTLNYTIEDSGLLSIDAFKERLLGGAFYRSGLTSKIGLNFNIDKRNNRINATRGFYASLDTELSGGFRLNEHQVVSVLGGDFNLWESQFNFRYFHPVSPKGDWLILRYNLSLGRIQTTDGTVVPFIHRYRAGGINSVRGFDWYSLGPSIRVPGFSEESSSGRTSGFFEGSDDPSAAEDRMVVGGTETWINNLELECPIVKSAGISTVIFFDAGNAFGDPGGNGHINPFGLRTSVGAGVRWQSPLGPLRFEWGIPLKPYADERKSVFDFSIGSFF
jgi:outer membrane protein insertion porin family